MIITSRTSSNTPKEPEFPKLVISDDGDILLVISRKAYLYTGTLISESSGCSRVGSWSDGWVVGSWADYKGEVRLTNG